MKHDRQAITLLNTRPVGQASPLTQLLTEDGIEVFECPALEIVSLPFDSQHLTTLNRFDVLFFISRNAVHAFFDHINPQNLTSLLVDQIEIYSIGKATQQALQSYGISSRYPETFTTEALLSTLPSCYPKQCLIVKGLGGLGRLAQGLKASGATVDEWSLYKRQAAPFCLEIWLAFRDTPHPVFLFSSFESAEFLLTAIGNQNKQDLTWAYQQPCIVFSERIKRKLIEIGWQGAISVVPSQSDQGVLKSLTNMH